MICDLIDICEYIDVGHGHGVKWFQWKLIIHVKFTNKFQYSFKTVLILKYTFCSVYTYTRIWLPLNCE